MDKALKLAQLFSRPPAVPPGQAKLVTIAFSHYCEKARWGLDLSPLREAYIEDSHMPVFHIPPTVRCSQDRKKTGTPLLVLPDGAGVLHDSALILQHLSQAYPDELGHLYPPGLEEQVRALERELGEGLGVQARRVAYWHMAEARRRGVSTANPALFDARTHVIPRVEAWLWWLLEGQILPKMLGFMDITEATAAAALEDCRAVFAKMSRLLEEGNGKYLLGTDKMTAADLTFAALAYPLVSPPQWESLGFGGQRMSPWVARLQDSVVAEFRATPAGQFALRLYAEERYPGQGKDKDKPCGALKLRTPNRNKYPWQRAAPEASKL